MPEKPDIEIKIKSTFEPNGTKEAEKAIDEVKETAEEATKGINSTAAKTDSAFKSAGSAVANTSKKITAQPSAIAKVGQAWQVVGRGISFCTESVGKLVGAFGLVGMGVQLITSLIDTFRHQAKKAEEERAAAVEKTNEKAQETKKIYEDIIEIQNKTANLEAGESALKKITSQYERQLNLINLVVQSEAKRAELAAIVSGEELAMREARLEGQYARNEITPAEYKQGKRKIEDERVELDAEVGRKKLDLQVEAAKQTRAEAQKAVELIDKRIDKMRKIRTEGYALTSEEIAATQAKISQFESNIANTTESYENRRNKDTISAKKDLSAIEFYKKEVDGLKRKLELSNAEYKTKGMGWTPEGYEQTLSKLEGEKSKLLAEKQKTDAQVKSAIQDYDAHNIGVSAKKQTISISRSELDKTEAQKAEESIKLKSAALFAESKIKELDSRMADLEKSSTENQKALSESLKEYDKSIEKKASYSKGSEAGEKFLQFNEDLKKSDLTQSDIDKLRKQSRDFGLNDQQSTLLLGVLQKLETAIANRAQKEDLDNQSKEIAEAQRAISGMPSIRQNIEDERKAQSAITSQIGGQISDQSLLTKTGSKAGEVSSIVQSVLADGAVTEKEISRLQSVAQELKSSKGEQDQKILALLSTLIAAVETSSANAANLNARLSEMTQRVNSLASNM